MPWTFKIDRWFSIILAGQICLFFLVKNDPFFGDATLSTSRAALNIYDQHLATIFYPAEIDPGHPPLYPWLMAAIWTIFGKTLWISHLFSCACMCLLSWVLLMMARLFLHGQELLAALLPVICFATYLSLSSMMLNTTLLMLFFLVSIYAVLTECKSWLMAGNVLMMITHLQGCFFLAAIALADLAISLFIRKQSLQSWIKQRFFYYSIPLVCFLCWLQIHYMHAGWYFRSPNYADTQELNGMKTYFKSLALIIWRLLDYGMLPVHAIAAFALIRKEVAKELAWIYLLTFTVTSLLIAVFLENTIAHRYFFPFHLLAIIIVISFISKLKIATRTILYALCLISIVAGNFLYYPGKTIGDATLAYRSYFTLEKRIYQDFGDSIRFYSFGPVANPAEAKWLNEPGLQVSRIDNASIDSLPAILQSNVSAHFPFEMQRELHQNWHGTSYENGAVYINVFLNPRYYVKPPGWQLRTPSGFESWLTEIKLKLKSS